MVWELESDRGRGNNNSGKKPPLPVPKQGLEIGTNSCFVYYGMTFPHPLFTVLNENVYHLLWLMNNVTKDLPPTKGECLNY